MNKSLIIPAFAAALLLGGCSGFLDIRTEATMPTTGLDYTKTENIFLPVSAAYASMRMGEGEAYNYVAVMEIASDDADKGSSPDDGLAISGAIDNFTVDPANTAVADMWRYFYDVVSASNYALESMDKFAKALTAEDALAQVRECRGEARIIRAWAYFNLARVFGTVPLVDRTMTAEELAAMKAASEEEVYKFVCADLDKAIEVLPGEWDGYPGRYTSWTARALKSRVALYMKDWKEAAAQADAVISSGRFSLLPDFRSVFLPAGENSSEILMSLQSSTLGQSAGDAPMCYYAFIQGPRNNSSSNLQGWGFKVPSQKLVDFLDARGDAARKAATILERGTVTPEGDEIAAICANPYYNGKVYTPSRYNKWSYNAYGRDYDIRLIRYSEVLLNYAEALMEGAPAGSLSADEALALVRGRAGLEAVPATLEAVREERHAELAMEDCRFFDLVRWGQAAEVLGPLGFKAGRNEHFPIPSAERQLNPNLPQSPGYTY